MNDLIPVGLMSNLFHQLALLSVWRADDVDGLQA